MSPAKQAVLKAQSHLVQAATGTTAHAVVIVIHMAQIGKNQSAKVIRGPFLLEPERKPANAATPMISEIGTVLKNPKATS